MKILFCIYQIDFADHIAISYLSAIAKKYGNTTFFCEFKDLEKKLSEVHPDIVAYSLNLLGFDEIVSTNKRLQKEYGYKVIAGGPHVTLNQNLFPIDGIDAACVGEGEGAFEDYIQCIQKSESYERVQNLITPTSRNPVRKLIVNLDEIPFPDRDLTIANTFLKDLPKKTFYSSRGCPYGCTYCGNSFINDLYRGNKIMRRFSPRRIIDEIKYVRDKYGLKFMKLGDEVFALKADDWLREFTHLYKEEVGIPWGAYLRFDTLNKDSLALLQHAGMYSCTLSVDSTSEYVREEILGRRQKRVDIEAQLRLIKEYNINTLVNFMLGAPGSTIEDDLQSIEMGRNGKVDFLPYTITTPVKGTKLYDYSVEHGLVPPDYGDEVMVDIATNEFMWRSPYNSFTEKEKDIHMNIRNLGGLVSKMPDWIRWFGYFLIKHTPPNRFYAWSRRIERIYMMEYKIFKLH